MHSRFLKRIALYMGLAIILTLGVSWVVSDRYCEASIRHIFAQEFENTMQGLSSLRFGAEIFLCVVETDIDKLQNSLNVLSHNEPSFFRSSDNLKRVCQFLELDSLTLFDEYGKVIASSNSGLKDSTILYTGADLSLDEERGQPQWGDDIKLYYRQHIKPTSNFSFEGKAFDSVLYFQKKLKNTPWFLRLGVPHSVLRQAFNQAAPCFFQTSLYARDGGGVDVVVGDYVVNPGLDMTPSQEADELYATDVSAHQGEEWLFTAERNGLPCVCQVKSYASYLLIAYLPTSFAYRTRTYTFLSLAVGHCIVFIILYIGIAFSIKVIVTSGIERICMSLTKITSGNYQVKVSECSSPEFATLSEGINQTVNSLNGLLAQREEAHTQQLELARLIQSSCLPHSFPIYPEQTEIDVWARAIPAQQVGGDFYDFFQIAPDKYCFVVADVSDHGVPAAMFMMTAHTIVRNTVLSADSLAQAVSLINSTLCENNDANMFLTAFIAVINGHTGEVFYVNAGHNPPLWWQAAGQKWVKLGGHHNFVLAGMENIPFSCDELKLQPDDQLFIYTDGVTDIQNSSLELYGLKRVHDSLTQAVLANNDSPYLLDRLQQDLEAYAGPVPIPDDITMMVVHYFGDAGKARLLQVATVADNLCLVQDFVDSWLGKTSATLKQRTNMRIVCEEIFLNICNYAYPQNLGQVTVRVDLLREPIECDCDDSLEKASKPQTSQKRTRVVLHFVDSGIPYDPLRVEVPDLRASLQERQVGGLGVYLVKQLTDSMEYRYADGHNILRITKLL